ncbi:MAG: Rossmann-like domain-containing protein [Pleomorphochaeta sp.]|jgi:uncharacterized protein (DUF4213/DUF364 family)
MTNRQNEIYEEIRNKFIKIIYENNLNTDLVEIESRGLSAQEAIGNTERKDYPILVGKEIMLQAKYKGSIGQAFTPAPLSFSGTIEDVLNLDLNSDLTNRGIFIATINAVLKYLNLSQSSIHCKDNEPGECAKKYLEFLNENYANQKVLLVGLQPGILSQIKKRGNIRVLDLNPDNIGKYKESILIEDGIKNYQECVNWADLILCTGSVFANGSMDLYLDIDKEVVFFGTSCSGPAYLLNLKRFCPLSK